MHIDWNTSSAAPIDAVCPACADTSPKSVRLTVHSAVPPNPLLPLALCGRCGTAFFPTLRQPEYESAHATEAALAFYLEQGAGIDVMAEPLSAIDPSKVRRYLEIGCGFGFSLDVARTVFGWSVQGIDPGFAARAGRDLLGLDISSTYLRTPADAGPDPFDLVLCSEVVEHIFEPLGFLTILRGVLAPGGTLLLTTPNAGAIAPDTAAGILVPLLSPGYHVTLYSREGFEALLRRAGFTAVSVSEHGPTLRATAAMVEGTADLSRRLDRARYLEYLEERSRTIAADTPLGLGLRYRRLKELVHAGRFAEAREAAAPVLDACRTRWGLELDNPESLPSMGDWPADIAGFHDRAPFSLCGILYCLGMTAWLHDDDRERARLYFQAAGEAGERARAALQAAGADDGETDDLAWRARGHAAGILAWSNPLAAADGIERLARDASPILGERVPPAILAGLRRQSFIDLVNLGHYAAADRLARGVEDDLAQWGPAEAASAAFALAILSLNHRKAVKTAAGWFGRAAEASREPVTPLLWPALYHQAEALAATGQKSQAAEALRGLLSPEPGLPAVPADLHARAQKLVRSQRLPV
ncbi:methyltransferase domain-containing protein [Azospirillum brasilense]|nr:class I SAM-dependent methyltransferase [Azospirillum brasilense]MBK3733626.1 methyltransferase domain-containing protein [Azospirillum brasilense]